MFPSLSKKKNIVDGPKFRIMEFELFPPTSRSYPRFDYEEICSKLEVGSNIINSPNLTLNYRTVDPPKHNLK